MVRAEEAKGEKYRRDYCKLGMDFTTFVISTSGCFGEGATTIINALAKQYAKNRPDCLLRKAAVASNLSHYIQSFTLKAIARNAQSTIERVERLLNNEEV